MAEPTVPVGGALIFTGASGAAMLVMLATMGISPERMGAGLFGAIISIAFFPPRGVGGWRLALLVLASMLLASYAGPIIAPALVIAGSKIGVTEVHSTAVSCAIVGAFPKPLIVLAQAAWKKLLKRYGVQDADSPA